MPGMQAPKLRGGNLCMFNSCSGHTTLPKALQQPEEVEADSSCMLGLTIQQQTARSQRLRMSRPKAWPAALTGCSTSTQS